MRAHPKQVPWDGEAQLLAVLRAVGDEIYALAVGIVELGDTLSGSVAADSTRLQAFDLLGQRAFAHAKLVVEIARMLDADAPDWEARLHDLIGGVPFATDRRRLSAALTQDEAEEVLLPSGGETEWL